MFCKTNINTQQIISLFCASTLLFVDSCIPGEQMLSLCCAITLLVLIAVWLWVTAKRCKQIWCLFRLNTFSLLTAVSVGGSRAHRYFAYTRAFCWYLSKFGQQMLPLFRVCGAFAWYPMKHGKQRLVQPIVFETVVGYPDIVSARQQQFYPPWSRPIHSSGRCLCNLRHIHTLSLAVRVPNWNDRQTIHANGWQHGAY